MTYYNPDSLGNSNFKLSCEIVRNREKNLKEIKEKLRMLKFRQLVLERP